jgi:beta-galactosidase/beta-glucuronidase
MKKFLSASLPGLYLCALFTVAGAQSRSLDGTWQFAVDREGKLTINDLSSVKDWREIRAPLSWNAQFADLRDYRGVAWYLKTVDLQPIKPDQTVLLKFGAVDYFAEVFVNGQKAGEHEGGYLPFELDVGGLIKAGPNEIAVRVTDPDNDKARCLTESRVGMCRPEAYGSRSHYSLARRIGSRTSLSRPSSMAALKCS